MPISIPLEDSFIDIISKGQRGLSINDEALSPKSGLAVAEIAKLKSGEVEESTFRKVTAALGLGAEALLGLAKSGVPHLPNPGK